MPNLDSNFYLDRQGVRTLINELETNVIAEEFSSSATYTLGSYCIYENNLYRCISPITTTGSWTGNTNWLQILVTQDIKAKTIIQSITLAQWEALTPEEKAANDYVITDAPGTLLTASNVPYDNTQSGISPNDVQSAIDYLVAHGGGIIDDTTPSTTTVYSSSKVEDLLDDKQDATDNSLATADKTIVGAINEINGKLIKRVSETIQLSQVTFTQSSSGMYYYEKTLNIPSGSLIVSISCGNWGKLRTTDIIEPYIAGSNKLGLMSNINAFLSGSVIELIVIYI